jgi:hypothetical protein
MVDNKVLPPLLTFKNKNKVAAGPRKNGVIYYTLYPKIKGIFSGQTKVHKKYTGLLCAKGYLSIIRVDGSKMQKLSKNMPKNNGLRAPHLLLLVAKKVQIHCLCLSLSSVICRKQASLFST